MTGAVMTNIGVIGAMLAFLLAGLPPETPVLVKLALGTLNAGVTFYLGKTNQGTAKTP